VLSNIVNPPHRRRNPRLDFSRRKNERPIRELEIQDQGHYESHVENGAEDGGGVEGLAGVLCCCYTAVLVGVVALRIVEEEVMAWGGMRFERGDNRAV
jgi:hypothetical protein